MGGEKLFTSINLFSGYWQYCIAYEVILKTAFFMRYGLYEQVVMPMGLMNAPATFMHTMNNLLSNMLDFGVAEFLYNIPVYSHIVKKHFMLLKKVLAYFYQHTFYCKLKKCSFLYNVKTFLGFNITPKGMHISDQKVQSLNKQLVPTTVKEVQFSLGFEQYF